MAIIIRNFLLAFYRRRRRRWRYCDYAVSRSVSLITRFYDDLSDDSMKDGMSDKKMKQHNKERNELN